MADSLRDFLDPVDRAQLSGDIFYREGQIGRAVMAYEQDFPDLDDADIVLAGCGEQRGAALPGYSEGPDRIRQEFYQLYYWHQDIHLADVGNIRPGETLADSYAAVKMVLNELMQLGKTVILLGGSHDLTLAQYHAFAGEKKVIDAVGIDAVIDINIDSPFRNENFLMELLTADPNYLRHYNHIGFQSYLVHPGMLETMDKLRFDCFRLGNVREHPEEMEPVIRNCSFVSVDISAMAHAYAPAGAVSPNGFTGEEICTLMQYAGMSNMVKCNGIFGYRPERDTDQLTAKQISQMIWYFLDGRSRGRKEAAMDETESFNEFHTAFAEVETTFLQSKKTGRWWMQLPDRRFIACSYKDYLLASSNEIPERWLRAQERI